MHEWTICDIIKKASSCTSQKMADSREEMAPWCEKADGTKAALLDNENTAVELPRCKGHVGNMRDIPTTTYEHQALKAESILGCLHEA